MDKEILDALTDVGQVTAVAAALSGKAEDYVNDPTLEAAWAETAFKHAETYFKLLQAIDGKSLKLTSLDDEIHENFRRKFPDLDVAKLTDDILKNEDAKILWREFCNSYNGAIEDFNFGTLLRLDAAGEYSEENSTITTRIQFLAIEIARNKAGLNSVHYVPRNNAKANTNAGAGAGSS